MESEQADKWIEAMEAELDSMRVNGICQFVEPIKITKL